MFFKKSSTPAESAASTPAESATSTPAASTPAASAASLPALPSCARMLGMTVLLGVHEVPTIETFEEMFKGYFLEAYFLGMTTPYIAESDSKQRELFSAWLYNSNLPWKLENNNIIPKDIRGDINREIYYYPSLLKERLAYLEDIPEDSPEKTLGRINALLIQCKRFGRRANFGITSELATRVREHWEQLAPCFAAAGWKLVMDEVNYFIIAAN